MMFRRTRNVATDSNFNALAKEISKIATGGGATIRVSGSQGLAAQYDSITSAECYFGEAAPGSATSDAVWRIKKIVFTGSDATVTWADGNADFDNVWNNRASLTYS